MYKKVTFTHPPIKFTPAKVTGPLAVNSIGAIEHKPIKRSNVSGNGSKISTPFTTIRQKIPPTVIYPINNTKNSVPYKPKKSHFVTRWTKIEIYINNQINRFLLNIHLLL